MSSDYANRLGGARSSLAFKAPCRVATTVNISLTGEQTIDGVAVVEDDRVLVKDQTLSYENGIYLCKKTAWVRAKDFNGADDVVKGTRVYVHSGASAASYVVSSADPISIGNSAIEFTVVADAEDLYTSDVPTSPASLTRTTKERQYCDLRDWDGLDSTGANDMASIVQDAATQSASAGRLLNVSSGKYRLDTVITLPAGTHIQGNGRPASIFSEKETFFHFNHSSYGFLITGGPNTRPRSLVGFGTYRTQPTITGGWAPTAHEWDILINGASDVEIDRVHLLNPTKAVAIIGHTTHGANGRVSITRVSGQPFLTGLYMTHCADACYVDEVHWWPFFSTDPNIYTYTRAAGIAFAFGKADNTKVGRIFGYGYSRGLYFFQQGVSGSLPTGPTALFKADVVGVDNSSLGLLMDADTDGASVKIDNFYAGSISSDGGITSEPVVYLLGDNARLEIDSLYGYNSNASLVQIAGTGNWVTLGAARSNNIDADANGTGEFDVATGNRLRLRSSPENTATTKYATAGTAVVETPDWRTYTPTITASSGTFTSVAATGRYRRLSSDTVEVKITITITTNGTAASLVKATLPFTPAQDSIFSGRETAVTGVPVTGTVTASVATLDIVNASSTYPGGDGRIIKLGGTYEVV